VLKSYTFLGENFLGAMSFLASNILIPIGGFFAVVMVGWVWGSKNALQALQAGASDFFYRWPAVSMYFRLCFKYTAPILIIIVFLHAMGVLV
jgi:neurotransmitter:Na+ symporter, NSS family